MIVGEVSRSDIALCGIRISLLREITCHMGSHRVTSHPAVVTFPHFPQPKLVLDLVTPEGCKAEFTWVVVMFEEAYLPKTATYLRNNQAVSWLGIEPATDHESPIGVLTARPSSQPEIILLNWITSSLSLSPSAESIKPGFHSYVLNSKLEHV